MFDRSNGISVWVHCLESRVWNITLPIWSCVDFTTKFYSLLMKSTDRFELYHAKFSMCECCDSSETCDVLYIRVCARMGARIIPRISRARDFLAAGARLYGRYRRGKVENWWVGWREVVGGNKALGTALLRPLIWCVRVYVYVGSRSNAKRDTPANRSAKLRRERA